MPLGKLSKRQIQSAYSLLTEVQQVSEHKFLKKKKSFIAHQLHYLSIILEIKSSANVHV